MRTHQYIDDVLYACTVHCKVYRLRHAGQKLARDEIERGRVAGTLRVSASCTDPGLLTAMLEDARSYALLPRLHAARVVKIERGGILLAGVEDLMTGPSVAPDVQRHRQAWWCVPSRS